MYQAWRRRAVPLVIAVCLLLVMPLTATAQDTAPGEPPVPPPTLGDPALRPSTPLRGSVLQRADVSLPLPFPRIEGNTFLPSSQSRVAMRPGAGLLGWCWPRAVVSPDQQALLYESASESALADALRRRSSGEWVDLDAVPPAIRLADARTGQDTALEDNACAPAWSASGRIAYLKTQVSVNRWGRQLTGRLVVRESLHSPTTTWVDDGAVYQEVIWAGDRLLAQRDRQITASQSVCDLARPTLRLQSAAGLP